MNLSFTLLLLFGIFTEHSPWQYGGLQAFNKAHLGVNDQQLAHLVNSRSDNCTLKVQLCAENVVTAAGAPEEYRNYAKAFDDAPLFLQKVYVEKWRSWAAQFVPDWILQIVDRNRDRFNSLALLFKSHWFVFAEVVSPETNKIEEISYHSNGEIREGFAPLNSAAFHVCSSVQISTRCVQRKDVERYAEWSQGVHKWKPNYNASATIFMLTGTQKPGTWWNCQTQASALLHSLYGIGSGLMWVASQFMPFEAIIVSLLLSVAFVIQRFLPERLALVCNCVECQENADAFFEVRATRFVVKRNSAGVVLSLAYTIAVFCNSVCLGEGIVLAPFLITAGLFSLGPLIPSFVVGPIASLLATVVNALSDGTLYVVREIRRFTTTLFWWLYSIIVIGAHKAVFVISLVCGSAVFVYAILRGLHNHVVHFVETKIPTNSLQEEIAMGLTHCKQLGNFVETTIPRFFGETVFPFLFQVGEVVALMVIIVLGLQMILWLLYFVLKLVCKMLLFSIDVLEGAASGVCVLILGTVTLALVAQN